jgi:hypothetical protein
MEYAPSEPPSLRLCAGAGAASGPAPKNTRRHSGRGSRSFRAAAWRSISSLALPRLRTPSTPYCSASWTWLKSFLSGSFLVSPLPLVNLTRIST